MNWAIKIISKTLITKISHVSWGGYDKGFYGIYVQKSFQKFIPNFRILFHCKLFILWSKILCLS